MFGLQRYILAQALVAASTVVALWIAGRWGSAAVEMIYLPAVLATGVWWGFGPALLAAVTSALSYNFFFTQPLHTLRMDRPVDIVDVVILFVVAVVTSQLASAIRHQAQLAETHATRNATIAGFARQLLTCSNEAEIAETACKHISTLFDCNCVVMAGLPHPLAIAATPIAPAITPTDIAAAVYALQTGKVAGSRSDRLAPAEWVFHPIGCEASPLAVMGLSRDDGRDPLFEGKQLLLGSLLDQTALAVSRVRGSDLPPRNVAAIQ
ncbi:MAG: hypothetical protein NVS9B15_10280 [Acidobacteriaceae bacterium]